MVADTGIEKAAKGGADAKEEKKVVAGGIAIAVVLILFVGWAIIFMHRIQNGAQQVDLRSGVPDEFNFTSVKQAQQQLQQSYNSINQDLQDIRDQAASGGSQSQQMQMMQTGGTDSGPFGAPTQ